MEAGSRNHEVVPTPLIVQLSGLRGGSGVHKSISNLAKTNLIAKMKNAKCMFCGFYGLEGDVLTWRFALQTMDTDSHTVATIT